MEVQHGGDHRDGDQRKGGGARDRRQVEEPGAHQWNIWAEPGW